MRGYTHKAYVLELRKLKRQLDALAPAATALGYRSSLSRLIAALDDHKIDVLIAKGS